MNSKSYVWNGKEKKFILKYLQENSETFDGATSSNPWQVIFNPRLQKPSTYKEEKVKGVSNANEIDIVITDTESSENEDKADERHAEVKLVCKQSNVPSKIARFQRIEKQNKFATLKRSKSVDLLEPKLQATSTNKVNVPQAFTVKSKPPVPERNNVNKFIEGMGIMTIIAETNKKLKEIQQAVSIYDGPKTDKQFLLLKKELNDIKENCFTMIQDVNEINIQTSILQIQECSDQILDTLYTRTNDFEEKIGSEKIRKINDEIMNVEYELANNENTVDKLNDMEKKLMNFLHSLDNIDVKDRAAVKQTIRNLHGILQLLAETKNPIVANKLEKVNPVKTEPSQISLNMEGIGFYGRDELISQIDTLLKIDCANAVTDYNSFINGKQHHIKDLKLVHKNAVEKAQEDCLFFTLKLFKLVSDSLEHFNKEVNRSFKIREETNKFLTSDSLFKIKEQAFIDLQREREEIFKFIEETKGEKDLPKSFQETVDKIYQSLDAYKDNVDHAQIIDEIKKYGASITKNINDKKSLAFINSLVESYIHKANDHQYGTIYTANLASKLQEMKSNTLKKFTINRNTTIFNDPYITKIIQDIDTVNKSILDKNYELWKNRE